MKEFYGKYKFFVWSILITYCVLLCTGIVFASLTYASASPEYNRGSIYLSSGWDVYSNGKQEASSVDLPYKIKDSNTKVVDIYNSLPTTPFEASVLTFNVYQKNTSIYVDKQLIYQHKFEPKQSNAETPGSGKLFIHLPDNFEGKTIHIQFERVVPQDVGPLATVDIINGMVNAQLFVPGDNLMFFIVTTIFMLGLILLIISAAFRSVGVKISPLVMLSLFAISSSIWFMCNSKMLQFFTENFVLMHNLEYMAFYLIPVTLWAFLHLNWDSRSKITVPMLILMFGFFMVAISLKFFGICDMFRLLTIFHILVLLNAIGFVFFELRDFKHKKISLKLFYAGIGFFFLGGLLDGIIFYTAFSAESMASNLVIGIILMGVCIMLSYVFSSKDKLKAHIESDTYKVLAYTDALTKIGNRLKFEEALEHVQEAIEEYHSISIINLDANGLKAINDTYGHLQGDEMLKTISRNLETIFADTASCYRIGGDEFCLISTNTDKRKLVASLETLDNRLREQSLQIPISVSHGITEYDSLIHDDIYEVFHSSDDTMYENKRNSKLEKTDFMS